MSDQVLLEWRPIVGEIVERRGRWGLHGGPLLRVVSVTKTTVTLENGETYRRAGAGWRSSPVNKGLATIHGITNADVRARIEAEQTERLRHLAWEAMRTASPKAVRECARILGLEVKS